MIVYVETNFILELAYVRPTSDNCQNLLNLARAKRITLVVPAFSLVEARLAWQRSVRRRNRLHAEVRTELGELSRSRPLTNIAAQSQAFVAALIDTAQQDRARLERAIEDTSDVGTVLSTQTAVVHRAFEIEQSLGLSPQDSLVYATVLDHAKSLESEPKVFVTQNANDFRIPTVEDELAHYNCKLLVAFDTAEAYVRSTNRS